MRIAYFLLSNKQSANKECYCSYDNTKLYFCSHSIFFQLLRIIHPLHCYNNERKKIKTQYGISLSQILYKPQNCCATF